jgi:hypothetical protein
MSRKALVALLLAAVSLVGFLVAFAAFTSGETARPPRSTGVSVPPLVSTITEYTETYSDG